VSNLTECKSCKKEVAKKAKLCPHCGAKLKMGMFLKLVIGLVVLIVVAAILSPSKEQQMADLNKKLNEMAQSSPSELSSSGDIAAIFSILSDHTDIQRENLEEGITGKIVQWTLQVYDVNQIDPDERSYTVQTSSALGNVGAFVTLYARNDAEAAYIENLKTDDFIRVRGRITGTTMRNIDIEDAILVE